jgi:hypothetical protein
MSPRKPCEEETIKKGDEPSAAVIIWSFNVSKSNGDGAAAAAAGGAAAADAAGAVASGRDWLPEPLSAIFAKFGNN